MYFLIAHVVYLFEEFQHGKLSNTNFPNTLFMEKHAFKAINDKVPVSRN